MNRQRNGNMHFAAAPGDHFETSDGRFIVITVSANSVFESLASAMDRPDLRREQPHAKVLAKPFHLRDLVLEVERVLEDRISARLQ